MLKIEVMKFETQDVITASTPAGNVSWACACERMDGGCTVDANGEHHGRHVSGEPMRCVEEPGHHTCGKY